MKADRHRCDQISRENNSECNDFIGTSTQQNKQCVINKVCIYLIILSILFPQLANVSKYRVTMRLLGELIIGGVFPKLSEGIKTLSAILSNMVNCDKESHVYVQVISSFARHCGEDFAGFTSRKQRLMSEKHKVTFPKCGIVPDEDQAVIHQHFLSYYKSLSIHLLRAHKDLQNRERQNCQTLMVGVILCLLLLS